MIATRRISIGFSASHHEKLIKSAGFARSQCSLRRRSRTHTFARISPSQKPSSSRSLSLFVDSSSTGMCSFVFCFFRSASFDPIFTLIGRFWTWIWSFFVYLLFRFGFFVPPVYWPRTGNEMEVRFQVS